MARREYYNGLTNPTGHSMPTGLAVTDSATVACLRQQLELLQEELHSMDSACTARTQLLHNILRITSFAVSNSCESSGVIARMFAQLETSLMHGPLTDLPAFPIQVDEDLPGAQNTHSNCSQLPRNATNTLCSRGSGWQGRTAVESFPELKTKRNLAIHVINSDIAAKIMRLMV